MTTTYAAIHIVANGQPYVFAADATDGTEKEMVNIVSGQSLGDTFSNNAIITSCMPVTLNSSDGTGASKSVLGAVITDPQNNVVAFLPWVDPEVTPIAGPYSVRLPVGLNYVMNITTSNT